MPDSTDVLDPHAIDTALAGLPGWRAAGAALLREVEAPTFLRGIDLVNAVAQVAESLDHHPDIDIRWRTVTFRLSTHSAGGVTGKDLELAERIEHLVGGMERGPAR